MGQERRGKEWESLSLGKEPTFGSVLAVLGSGAGISMQRAFQQKQDVLWGLAVKAVPQAMEEARHL